MVDCGRLLETMEGSRCTWFSISDSHPLYVKIGWHKHQRWVLPFTAGLERVLAAI